MLPVEDKLFSSHARRKMATGLFSLVCAAALLCSVQAQDQLPENYMKGVDLALEQLNAHAGVHHHFRFLRSVEKSDIEVKQESGFISFL